MFWYISPYQATVGKPGKDWLTLTTNSNVRKRWDFLAQVEILFDPVARLVAVVVPSEFRYRLRYSGVDDLFVILSVS